MDRSRNYFLVALSRQTGAYIDESHDAPAVERRNFMMHMSQPKGKVCVSLGCGLGRFLHDYTKHGARVVVGLDLNLENLKRCKVTGAYLVLGDLENMPFKDDAFDISDCEATMEHITNPVRAMREVRRISAESGYSFVTWHVYRWLNVISSRTIRLRFILNIRDVIVNTTHLGRSVEKMRENKILKVFSVNYGTYRNAGFSFSEIQRVYSKARMGIGILRIYGHVIFITSKLLKSNDTTGGKTI